MSIFSPIRNGPKKKHIHRILPPTQSRDNPAHLFMFMCFSFPEFQAWAPLITAVFGMVSHFGPWMLNIESLARRECFLAVVPLTAEDR